MEKYYSGKGETTIKELIEDFKKSGIKEEDASKVLTESTIFSKKMIDSISLRIKETLLTIDVYNFKYLRVIFPSIIANVNRILIGIFKGLDYKFTEGEKKFIIKNIIEQIEIMEKEVKTI